MSYLPKSSSVVWTPFFSSLWILVSDHWIFAFSVFAHGKFICVLIVIVILGPLLSECVGQHAPMDFFDDEEAILKQLRAVQGAKWKQRWRMGTVGAWVREFLVLLWVKMIDAPSLAIKMYDRRFKDKYVIKPHIHSSDGSSKLRFWKCRNADHYKTWTKLLNWQNYICCKCKQQDFLKSF